MPSSSRDSGSRIIVALDYPAVEAALAVVDRLEPGQCRLKVGFELFTRAGPALVERLIARGFDVFLDMKYHDIPNTVAGACRAAAELGVWMVNVHALGGERMMAAAREAVDRSGHRPRLIAVTILTSHSAAELAAIGLPGEPQKNVMRLAAQAAASGLDGVVCSAHEAAGLRARQGADFLLVTPGIRPAGSGSNDQSRVMTPAEAVAQGADYLVIGRPITHAADPAAAVREINAGLYATDGIRS